MKTWYVLAIDPGSTSTKIGVFRNNHALFTRTIEHTVPELERYTSLLDELPMRKKAVQRVLERENFDMKKLDALVGRGGLLRPIPCGTYSVSREMVEELRVASLNGGHASNLGGLIARALGDSLSIPSYIVDPVIVDELMDEARFTGLPQIRRKSIWHALNQKAMAHRAAADLEKTYEELNLIVVHLGGGITIGAHRKGKVVDVNDGLNGDGPFTPQRTGSLPAADVVELCFSGNHSKDDLLKIIRGKGGLVAYLGTHDAREVCALIDRGHKRAEKIYQAMAYRISCSVAAMAVPLEGKIDGIILTGGLAREERLIGMIRERISFLGRVMIYPGENELEALVMGTLRVLERKEEASDYIKSANKRENELSSFDN